MPEGKTKKALVPNLLYCIGQQQQNKQLTWTLKCSWTKKGRKTHRKAHGISTGTVAWKHSVRSGLAASQDRSESQRGLSQKEEEAA